MTYIRPVGNCTQKNSDIGYVVYSIQTWVRSHRGHCLKGNHPLSKHAFNEIMNTTKVTCIKVYIVDIVARLSQSPNKI